ncbi:MAG TPA: FtsX-like permease family protein, partial [Vicinamibacteria bacterium]
AGGGTVGASRGRARMRGVLVSGQLAFAVTLLLVAGLAVRAALALRELRLGFEPRGVLTLKTELPAARYASDDAVRAFASELESALATVPGVSGAATGTARPVVESLRTETLSLEGSEPPREEARPFAAREVVSAGYFRALGIAILAGRPFAPGDGPGAPPVVVVNQALATRYLKDRDPLGARIRLGSGEAPWLTVVGVAADVVNAQPGEPSLPQVYLPFAQHPTRTLTYFVRTAELASVTDVARREAARLDPEQALYDVKTMERVFFEELAADRVVTGLFAVFAAVALALAGVGLYGLVSYGVSQRTREIGVRLAVGARGSDIVRLVMHDGMRLVLSGLGVGLVLGYALARVMASVLRGVSPHDPLTFGVVPATLALVALAATLVPARRAARLDPVRVLRSE